MQSVWAQKAIDPDKVALYIRWSTEDQGQGTTLAVQLDGCRHFALSQGWTVRADLIFIDDGYSGGSLDRPAMARLRAAAAADQVDCVVVYKIDRLSRNVVDTVNLVIREWEGRCFVKSAREAIDTTNHAGRMFFYTLVNFAEWERSTIRDRMQAGKLRRAMAGRSPGYVRPYGYRVGAQPGATEVDPAEAEVVQRLFREYVGGAGARSLAHRLNAEGIGTRHGRPWSQATVSQILRNPAYTGTLVYGASVRMPRDRRPGTPSRVRREQPQVVVENCWPAIVDPETFALAQAVRQGRPHTRRGEPVRALASPHLLTGLMVCARCGSRFRGRKPQAGRKGGEYICSGRWHRGTACCDCAFIARPAVDRLVVERLMALYGGRLQRERCVAALTAGLAQREAQLEQALAELGGREATVVQQQVRIRGEYRAGTITLEEFRLLRADAEADLAALSRRRAGLEAELAGAAAARRMQAHYLRAAGELDRWEALGVAERKHLLRQFISELRVFRADRWAPIELEVAWKVPGAQPEHREHVQP